MYARQLVADGLIGPVHEIESAQHFYLSPFIPYSWLHGLELGGGALNNVFTHKLGQVLYITGGKVAAVASEARYPIKRAPVGAAVHDFRTMFTQIVEPDQDTEWRAVDADMAYALMAQLQMPDGTSCSALFQCSAKAVGRNSDYLAVYGEQGTLHLTGNNSPDRIEHFDQARGEWQELVIPATDQRGPTPSCRPSAA